MTELRALICEDSPDDADLLRRALERGGYELTSTRVQTAADMQTALDESEWDVVFSDWHMPQFDALEALEILHQNALDLPFIIVSGTIGEEVAVNALRSGAHDFFSKDRLVRLVSAVEREMREKAIRRDRAQMEEQLMISDRMASVGILAAGVGHEINNPLSAVLGNLQLALDQLVNLRRELGDNSALVSLEDCLTDARQSAERIRDVSSDLRLFSRADIVDHTCVDVASVIQSSLRMARTELRHRGRVVTDLQPVPMVTANESQLGQVLLNLIVNAAQAIPEGHVEENEITVATRLSAAGNVVIEVRDTGSGMTPEVRKHLFTPFFTSKGPGAGTGLGLSICHRITTSLGGTITVESEIGKGSVFRLELPATTETPADAHDADDQHTAAAPPSFGAILTIDDEPSVRNLMHRVLAGHHVTSAAHAAEALQLIESGARFDLILCDLMMPQMSGMTFYERLGALAPEQVSAIVFVTGGAFTDRASEFLVGVENQVIEKPFDINFLRTFVDARLANRPR